MDLYFIFHIQFLLQFIYLFTVSFENCFFTFSGLQNMVLNSKSLYPSFYVIIYCNLLYFHDVSISSIK